MLAIGPRPSGLHELEIKPGIVLEDVEALSCERFEAAVCVLEPRAGQQNARP